MSAKDKIIALPNPRLRQKSQRLPIITPEAREVIRQMIDSTLDWEATREHEVGVALAAVQIDQPYRIIIVRNDFENKDDKNFSVFINPEIMKAEGKVEEDYEGCLSVTDIYGKVPRYSKVRVRALDENGQVVRVKAEGFLARIFQHEIDHTNGIMFVDHLKDDKDAFYKLTSEGRLDPLSYEEVEKTGVFQD
ncbi:MAG TPA: peptide deformylase [Candidatus Saccharimonadales bacterium]|nr:peptide deformylase [Candidatus Saccharimonadales bacterium]